MKPFLLILACIITNAISAQTPENSVNTTTVETTHNPKAATIKVLNRTEVRPGKKSKAARKTEVLPTELIEENKTNN